MEAQGRPKQPKVGESEISKRPKGSSAGLFDPEGEQTFHTYENPWPLDSLGVVSLKAPLV